MNEKNCNCRTGESLSEVEKEDKMVRGNIPIQCLKDITNQEISIHKSIGSANLDGLYEKSAHRRVDHFLFIFSMEWKQQDSC
jgi:hypothetical protein